MKLNASRYKDIQYILLVSYITWYLIIHYPSDCLIFIFYDLSDYFIVCSMFYFKSFTVKNPAAGSLRSNSDRNCQKKKKTCFLFNFFKCESCWFSSGNPGSSQCLKLLPLICSVYKSHCSLWPLLDYWRGVFMFTSSTGHPHWSGFSWPI